MGSAWKNPRAIANNIAGAISLLQPTRGQLNHPLTSFQYIQACQESRYTRFMTESWARLIFGMGMATAAGMRGAFHSRAASTSERIPAWEGPWLKRLRFFAGPAFLVFALLYLIAPDRVAFAHIPIPPSIRWLGAGLFATGLLLLMWVHVTLDRHFSGALSLRNDHLLIEHGPYRRVRHPMYFAFLVMILGIGILTANWGIGIPPLFEVLAIMLWRTPVEEEMLTERFGDAYRQYIRRTHRFFPI